MTVPREGDHMGYLVGNGLGDEAFRVLTEQNWVVADDPGSVTSVAGLARRPPTEVESNLQVLGGQTPLADCLVQEVLGPGGGTGLEPMILVVNVIGVGAHKPVRGLASAFTAIARGGVKLNRRARACPPRLGATVTFGGGGDHWVEGCAGACVRCPEDPCG